MPYAIVETTNARGGKELSVVPDKWLRSSRSGNVVLWPNVKKATEQHKLLRDENSCPKKSWLKYKCAVKQHPIATYDEAQGLLEELSGESSSDVGQLIQRRKKRNTRDAGIYQKMLVPEKEAATPRKNEPGEKNLASDPEVLAEGAVLQETPPAPVVVEVRGDVTDEFVRQPTAPPPAHSAVSPGTPPAAPIVIEVRCDVPDKFVRQEIASPPAPPAVSPATPSAAPIAIDVRSDLRDKFVRPVTALPPAPPTVVEESSGVNVQAVEYVTYEAADDLNSESERHAVAEEDHQTHEYLREIIEMQLEMSSRMNRLEMEMSSRMDRLEKRTADISTQNEFILDAIRKFISGAMQIDESSSFRFDPMNNEQDLNDLELKLVDKDFKANMVKWLRLNVVGDCADNRMLRVLDLLFSKELQTKCTWTGASRKGPKIAIMPNRNMLQLFQEIGSDDSEIVTQSKLASFFMRKLKNSLKRLLATGVRQGTRHVIRKKKQRKEDERDSADESDAAGSTIDSSDAMDAMDRN